MMILIDQGYGFDHFFDVSESVTNRVPSMIKSGETITGRELLQELSGNKHLQDVGGWLIVNQLPGEPEPITRWQRLVNAVNSLEAENPLRKLGLK